ncbi:MAG: dissimilatory sulfite reductase D family protein [Desulfovibrio sp.]|nr:dissimilatory sulfite reductase D family protein [Desulfovibrio sp.]
MAGVCTDEEREKVVDFLNGKSSVKSKFYFQDFLPLFPDKKPREVKKVLSALIDGGVLEYWSSGSTTMYGLKGAGKQSAAEGES